MVDIQFHCNEKGNFREGFPVRAFTYTDYSIQMHNHDFYEVNIVLSGTGTHCIENGRLPVRRGDVFVIPPMVAHAYVDTKELEVYHILMQKGFLTKKQEETAQVNGFLQLTEIEPFLRNKGATNQFLHLKNAQLAELKRDLEILDDNSLFCWETCRLMKEHTLWKLLYWFSELLARQRSETETASTKYEPQIFKALEYMHLHYSEKITIERLAKEVFLSRSTFLRSFRAVCEQSPLEYLTGYRCKKAAEQLESAQRSKTEIAHSCGFYDLSHMERMLKKYN